MGCKIKICGLMRDYDALICNTYRPDYAGFIFWKKSRRFLSTDQAAKLRSILDRSIQTVGVFVDAPVSEVAKIAEAGIIDIVQLHGQEDNGYIRELRKVCGLPVIKAFRLGEAGIGEDSFAADELFDRINQSEADYVLVDSGAGSGVTFDWEVLSKVKREFFLAGGLSPDNVLPAMGTGAFALDVSSGVETAGYKDADKIRRMIQSVRG